MKQCDLIKKLEDGGFIFERHGGGHDIYTRGWKVKVYQDIKKLMND